jgi:hypothetical protein
VKVPSIENGGNWVTHLPKIVDKAAALGRRGPLLGGPAVYPQTLQACDPITTGKILRATTGQRLGSGGQQRAKQPT